MYLPKVLSCNTISFQCFEGLVGKLAEKLSDKVGGGNDKLETAAYVLTTYAVLEVAENVFQVGKGFTSLDLTGFKLYQIKKGIDRIEKKVDKLLEAPMKLASRYYDDALDMLMCKQFKDAFDNLNKVIDKASEAFHYTADKKINMETFKQCIEAVTLITFATIMKNCYDHSSSCFYPYFSLDKAKKQLIANVLERWVNDCIQLKERVEITSWMPGSSKKELKVQNVLDSILKICYPFISQGHGFSDFNTDLVSVDQFKTTNVTLNPLYIPEC